MHSEGRITVLVSIAPPTLGSLIRPRERGALYMQIHAAVRDRDRGAEAERENSGGSFVWLSPGVSYALSRKTQIYGFVQLQLYQHVSGVQLTADRTMATGVVWRY